MTTKERSLLHLSGGQTKHILQKPGENSYCSSLIATSYTFNPSEIGHFPNSTSNPGNGTTLQAQTYYLNGQAHNGFTTKTRRVAK
jgi:hypothetical protein